MWLQEPSRVGLGDLRGQELVGLSGCGPGFHGCDEKCLTASAAILK